MSQPKHARPADTYPTSVRSDHNDLLRAFLDNSSAVAWLKAALGRHVFLSEPYLLQIGVPTPDWFGKTDFEL